MFNFITGLMRKERKLILDKEDVMTVLEVLDTIRPQARFYTLMSMEIGNCRWAKEPAKWYMSFTLSNKNWRTVINGLHKENRRITLKGDERYYLEKE